MPKKWGEPWLVGSPQDLRCYSGCKTLDKLDLVDIGALGLAVKRELVANDLHNVGVACLSKVVGGIARAEARAVQYGALDDLVCLKILVGLLYRAGVDIALADDNDGVEVMRKAAKLPDLWAGERHRVSLS